MKSLSFANFQVGIVDDPSVEDQGGFEFASGMDIFSEPGVLKACNSMTEVSYGAGATPTDLPRCMVDAVDSTGTLRAYAITAAKLLECTNGTTFNLFRTNSNGYNLGLGIWNGYVVYLSDTKIGRALLGNSGSANDSYLTTLTSATEYPIVTQGGTLKIGSDRYVASLDEAFVLTPQAMKLASQYKIRCLSEHFTNLFMGTWPGLITSADSSAFSWRGTVLSSGSALPDSPFPMKQRGMHALLSDGLRLYAFVGQKGDVFAYQGAGFDLYRQLVPVKTTGSLTVNPNAVTEHDKTILFAGDTAVVPGVFQMKNGALCQAFVPATATPGTDASFNITFLKSSFNGIFYMGYYRASDTSFHIEKSTSNMQNNAMVRTLWHKAGTDKLKRWAGVKLNLKPLAASTSVDVAYRTSRAAAWSSSQGTITSANQDKPILFAVQPRTREIQFKFTYTTATTNTPELLSYDPIFEVINSNR